MNNNEEENIVQVGRFSEDGIDRPSLLTIPSVGERTTRHAFKMMNEY
jgi:hypothetical protein